MTEAVEAHLLCVRALQQAVCKTLSGLRHAGLNEERHKGLPVQLEMPDTIAPRMEVLSPPVHD